MKMFDKVLGGLLGAAVGDAMGAATEMRNLDQIKDYFGGLVKDFKVPPSDTFAKGREPGQITDDFSLTYFIAKAIVENEGAVTEEIIKNGILEWADNDEYFRAFAGPTTRAAIEEFRGNKVENKSADPVEVHNSKATNGSAMKISPIGLINPGNIDKAIEDAVTACLPTHNTHLSISGACAVAAAISEAMKDGTDTYRIVQAGLYGARLGAEKGKEVGIAVAGPSVEKRMELAINIGLKSTDMLQAMKNISDYVGSGLHISEAVPAAFGLFIAAKGDTMESIYGGVNIGNDTDTVATIVGSIAGAFNGYKSMPEKYLDIISEKNSMNLRELAERITQIAGR